MIVWLDGRFLPEAKALVPATDRAFLHGRGLFETLRAYDGVAFRSADHLARLRASAKTFGMTVPKVDADRVVRDLCRRNDLKDAAVRLTLSAEGRLLITTRPRRPVAASWYEKGAKVEVARWIRDPRSPLAGHKVTSYLENVLAHEEALERGYADLLFVGPRGELLEGAVSNLFLVAGGVISTPSAEGILPGVTRKVVMELEKVREQELWIEDLKEAEEAFLTNALIEILPIGKPGPVTRRIAAAYRGLTGR